MDVLKAHFYFIYVHVCVCYMCGGAQGEQKSMLAALVPESHGGETPKVGTRNQTLFSLSPEEEQMLLPASHLSSSTFPK